MPAATEQLNGKAVKVRSHIGHAGLVQIIAFQAEGQMAGAVVGRGSGETLEAARESAGLPADPPGSITVACQIGKHNLCAGHGEDDLGREVGCGCPCHSRGGDTQ